MPRRILWLFGFVGLILTAHCDPLPGAQSKLLMLFTLSRHGDRSPINELPGDPFAHQWTSGYGQLTGTGAAQHIELGQFIRNQYNSFIPPVYRKDQCFFRSSGTHRTLMSANSFIAGLYQSELGKPSYIPPPVFSLSEMDDHLLKMSANCPEYRKLLHMLLDSPSVASNATAFMQTISQLQIAFPEMYADTMGPKNLLLTSCKVCDHVTIWISRKFPNRPAWLTDRIVSDCHALLAYKMYLFYSTMDLRRFRGGPLAAHLFRLLRSRANAELGPEVVPPKQLSEPLGVDLLSSLNRDQHLVAYFAHDSTLTALMTHLGIFNGLQPPLASCLLIELHHIPQAASAAVDQFFVRFLYRNSSTSDSDQLVRLWPPACGSSQFASRRDHLCPLSHMESAIRGTYVLQTQSNKCEPLIQSPEVPKSPVPNCDNSPAILLVLILFVLLFYVFIRLVKPKCRRYTQLSL